MTGTDGPDARGDVVFFDHVSLIGDAGQAILENVSCDLPLRGINVILGPSGAGKTTLLRLCNRLEVPTSGRVVLGGDDVADLDPLTLRRRVGMVFQRPTLFGGTIRDNLEVALAAGAHPSPDRQEAAFASALDVAGLADGFLDRPADEISGGEAQRVCIARALLTHPQMLLMDEPTASLDPYHRDVIERLARNLADSGLTILWVTHDLAQAQRLADHTLVLIDGRVATATEADAFVAGEREGDDA
jgi:putative ABC transport system ATP-binding protein